MLVATIKDGSNNQVVTGLENVPLDNAHVVRLGIPPKPGVYNRTIGSGRNAERYVVVVIEK